MSPEQQGSIGLAFLLLATLGAAALVHGVTNNATLAVIAAVAVFGGGLHLSDKVFKH